MNDNILDTEVQVSRERERESPDIQSAIHLEDEIGSLGLRPLIKVNKSTSVHEAFDLMAKNDIGCVLVEDDDEKLVGIFTERDMIRRVCGECAALDKHKVADYMSGNPDTLERQDSLAFALNRMCEYDYRHVPIIDSDQHPQGVVSMRDIVKQIGAFYRKEILNLPPEPVHTMHSRESG